ncbi:MAG: potassium transporter TrkH [Planctomycetes bacterium]|nr:potassium transporter TrkH [Planctomycetota bacterium]MCB9889350.1 potassium transporter TrkH [Planctomycetota bacterium]
MSRRLHATTSGALLASGSVPWAIASWAHGGLAGCSVWLLVLLLAASSSLLASALLIGRRALLGRSLATAGLVATLGAGAPRLWESPALTVVLAIAASIGLAELWKTGASLFFAVSRGHPMSGRVRGSAAVAFVFWLVVALGGRGTSLVSWVAVGTSMAIAVITGAVWAFRRRARDPRSRTLAVALGITALLATFTFGDLPSLVGSGSVYALVAVVFGPRVEDAEDPGGRWWAAVMEHPERLLITTFATLAGLGTLVLALPQSAASGSSVRGLDAAFTSVSAVCVTGLIVCDTPTDFSRVGQVAILVLIQLGGLGMMTFSTAALRVLGGRMSFRQESAVAHLIGAKDRSRVIASAQDVLRVTFVAESVGAVVLAALFVSAGDPLGTAIWRGCFTSISAYCNAGFALQSDSLVAYQSAPMVLHVVAALIVLGGMSPAVILALAARSGRRGPLSAHAKICVASAAALLVLGFCLYLLWEWEYSLAGLSVAQKLHNAWFQSATLRTAGFNSVDLSNVNPTTYILMLGWMFVGASPGGTAGGVKTTTVAVMALSVAHTIRGGTAMNAFGRRIEERTVQRASVIVTVALGFAVLAVIALALTQRIPLSLVVFEVVSALGTVGLTQGATELLDEVGKVIIMVCMFVGRIGGLTMMMFMSQRSIAERIVLPIEEVDVG